MPHLDSDLICKLVFVAHLLMSAIWLLWKTLGRHAPKASTWSALVDAAQNLADSLGSQTSCGRAVNADEEYGSDFEEVPPSGQLPPEKSS